MIRYIDAPAPSVFIYCDAAAHPRRVAVTNFEQVDPVGSGYDTAGSWNERYTSAAAQGTRESGTTLIGNRLPDKRELFPGAGVEGIRSRYELRCRKCRQVVTVREERLFAALNVLTTAGVSSASLTLLAAIVARIDAS